MHNNEDGEADAKEPWTDGGGFSVARWKLWKERWAAMASVESFSEKACAATKGALEAMKKAEA